MDRVVGGLDPAAMAALYRESDVLLKLSRVEGLGLAPVEGFHSGLPCVVTPYTGHEEYAATARTRWSWASTTCPARPPRWIALARDGALLASCRQGALATAARLAERRGLIARAVRRSDGDRWTASGRSRTSRSSAGRSSWARELGRAGFDRRPAATRRR